MSEQEETQPPGGKKREPSERDAEEPPDPEGDQGATADDEAEFEFHRADEFPDSRRPHLGGPPRRWDRF